MEYLKMALKERKMSKKANSVSFIRKVGRRWRSWVTKLRAVLERRLGSENVRNEVIPY